MNVIIKTICNTLLTSLIVFPAMAADCGNWRVDTQYVGEYGDGMENILTIKKMGRCDQVRVLYYVGPLGSFGGDQGTHKGSIDEAGRLTFWRNGILVSYTPGDQNVPYREIVVIWGAESKNPAPKDIGKLRLTH